MKGLTKRQRDIVNYIQEYIAAQGYSPSYREIMKSFGYSSLASVYKHIQVLTRKGVISNEKHCPRSLAVHNDMPAPTNSSHLSHDVPLIGQISAGLPIETFPKITFVPVSNLIIPSPENCYAFQIRDNTLINDFITDGDIIIVEANQDPAPGDLIVASIRNNETIIKRYYPEGLYIRLEAPHSNNVPITIRNDEISVQGTVKGLMRLYS